jgi:S1/P1 Nuclease
VKKNGLIILVFICSGYNLLAWANQGHKIVAQVTKNQLKQNIIDSVNFYLNGTPWEDAAIWMNEVKKDPQYDYMLPWHSIIIAKDKTYVKGGQPNLVNRIELYANMLTNRLLYTREEVKKMLMVLFHLVGDLHQPLNCGYPEDMGGRRLAVYFMGRKTNLYKVWDNEIISEKEVNQWDGARINLALTRAEIAKIRYGKVVDWLNDTRQTLDQVYDYNYGMIGSDYVTKNKTLIENQLVKAAMRLANLLTVSFSKMGSRTIF